MKLLLKYQLTKLQQQAVNASFFAYYTNTNLLINAVTGAGKTQIVMPIIYHALKSGKKVAFICPRKDILYETYADIKEQLGCEFNYASSSYRYYKQTLNGYFMTAHQLFKYKDFFDVIIFDEIDAFPFCKDVKLASDLKKSLKAQSTQILLTATPTIRQRLKYQQLTINQRVHLHLLDLPKICHDMQQLSHYAKQLSKQARLIIFVKSITKQKQLQKQFYNWKFYNSHTKDLTSKIAKFELNQIICATAILERGFTFEHLNIIIIDDINNNFDKNTLIQMYGRVGRKFNSPHGKIVVLTQKKSFALNSSISYLKSRNKHCDITKLKQCSKCQNILKYEK